MKQKYVVTLNQEEQKNIQKILNSNTTSTTIKKRANILLMCDNSVGKPGTQQEIAKRCGTTNITVYNTLKDYTNTGIEHTLKFKRTKTTNPPIITGDIEARIITLACGKSPNGHTRWTIRLLTEKIIELEIIETVSRETVRNVLKKHNLDLI